MGSAEKILVIGGQGPAGSWIARALLEERIDFVLFDRRPDNSLLSQVIDPHHLPAIERAFGDPRDPSTVARAAERHRATRLIHLAGGEGAGRRGGRGPDRRPGSGPGSALEAARTSGGRVAMTAYASGSSGDGEEEARRQFLDHRVPSVGLREVEVFGVGRETGLGQGFTRAIKAAVLDRRFTIPFTGTAVLAYAEDVARAFIAAAIAGAPAAVVARPRTEDIAVEAFIARLAETVPESAGRITSMGDPIPAEILVDESGLEDLPGVSGIPLTSLEEGIRRTVEHFRRLAGEGRLRDDGLPG